MPISNITRTNTVDEWRIQTNLSANALNKLETGNYDKTAGSLNIACTAVLSITSSGTGLSVANNALVSGDFTVGKSIALGSEGAATGNLTVGANTFIYGRGAALFVANSAIVNVSIQATQSIRTNNFIANTDASITGTAQIGYLTVNNSTAIGTTLDVVGNTTVGNLVTANSVVGDNGRFSSNVVASHFVTVAGSLVADSARITSNATFGETTAITINATNARISGNANVAHVTATGSLVADSARITANATFGETTATTINSTNARISGNANVAHLTASASVVADSARIAANSTASHFVASGSFVADSARITANATFGETTATTINATNARISGNANVSSITASNSLVADNARITANTTGAHFIALGSLVADNARIAANATFGETTATTINSTNARISANANVAHLTSSGSVVADSLRITSATASANISGNVVAGNVNTQGMVYAGSLRTSGRADVDGAFTVAGDASVSGKLTVSGDFVLSGDIVYDTDVLSISTVTPVTTTGAAYYGVFRGNTSGGVIGHNMAPSAVIVNGRSYRVSSLGSTTLVQWQARFSSLTGIPTVGQIIVATSSGNLAGGGLVTDRDSDANAYIRWAASSNTWQIRDVFNPDVGTTYSKILTANLISDSLTSTSTDTFLSSSGAKSLKDSINTEISDRQTANTNMKNYVDVANTNMKNYVDVTVTTANTNLKNYVDVANTNMKNYVDVANTNMKNYVDVANTNLKNYVDVTVTTANTNLKNYVDVTVTTANTNMKNYVDTRKTSNIAEETNLYYTDARVRAAVGVAATFGAPLSYISANGAFQHLNSGVTAATHGSASQVPVFVVNASGHITSVTNTNIAIASGAVSGLAASATTNALDASNINAGTLAAARLPAFSGDITTTAGSSSTTLATVNTTTGNFGGAATVPVFTVNGKGLVTYAGNVAIAIASGAVSGLAASATTNTTDASNISSGTLPAGRLPAFSGDITTTAGSSATTLANSGVTAQSVGSATHVSRFTVDAKGRITSANSVAIAIASSAVSGLATSATTDATNAGNISSGTLAAARLPAFSGDITTTAGSSATTLATVNTTTGNFGGAATVPVFTVNGKGLVTYSGNVAISIASSAVSGLASSATTDTTNATNISSGTLAVARGGTGLSSYTSSGVLYASGTGTLASGSNFVFDGTNVGIGASSPSTYGKFVVGGTGSFTSSFVSTSSTNTDKPTLEFRKTMDVGSGVTNTIGRLSFFGKLNTTIGEQAYLNVTSTNLSGVIDNNELTLGVRALSVGVNSSYLQLSPAGVTLQAGSQYGSITMNANSITIDHPTQEIVYDANYHDFYGSGVFNSNLRSVSLGVGTAASGTTGEIRATGDITAGYSDDKLKTRLGNIENALEKVSAITGFYYEPNQTARDLGYIIKKEVGVSAQEVQAVLPEVVVPAPVDSRYLTVHYEKLIPLLIEAIKELKAEVDELKKK